MSVVTISLCFSANKHEGAASMNEDDKRINNNLNKELRLIMDNKIDDKKSLYVIDVICKYSKRQVQ